MIGLRKSQQVFAADLWREDLCHARELFLDDHLSAARRLNVYRNNFLTSLTDALSGMYPVITRLVGDEFFSHMANGYVREFPSRSGNLQEFGARLPAFIGACDAAAMLPYLADVARLEWAYHTVFNAAAPPPFDPSSLGRMASDDFPSLHFVVGSACRIVQSAYPIFRIWQVNQDDYIGNDSVDLDAGPESVLVIRPKLEVELWRLKPAESAFLDRLNTGSSFGEAVEEGLKWDGEFNLPGALTRYLASSVLTIAEDQTLTASPVPNVATNAATQKIRRFNNINQR